MTLINMGRSGLRIAALCMGLFNTACDSDISGTQLSDSQRSGQRPVQRPVQRPGQIPSQGLAMDWRSMLDSLPGSTSSLPSVVLPEDLQSHAGQVGESFEARWAMSNAEGQSFTVFFQLDRLKFKEDTNHQSSWAYNSVARSIAAIGNSDNAVMNVHEVFSRVALGLADSRGNEFIVGNTSLSLGQSDSCRRKIKISHRDETASARTLSAQSYECPQSISLGTMNQWAFNGIPAEGILAGEKVEGVLWLTHRWGASANLTSAVVLDELRLVVTDDDNVEHWLNVTRSKRRSGRGPQTILASIRDAKGHTRELTVEWVDDGEIISPVTGIVYPETIRVQVISIGLDVVLSPVVRLSEIRDSLQTRWSGALDVSGSHSGMAYLDFMPIPQSKID